MRSAIEHRGLLWELTKREHRDRYAGQMLGVAWSIGHPLFLMLLYVFIFSFVFRRTSPRLHHLSVVWACPMDGNPRVHGQELFRGKREGRSS